MYLGKPALALLPGDIVFILLNYAPLISDIDYLGSIIVLNEYF